MSETARIELTEAQEEVIEWLVGAPLVELWGDLDEYHEDEIPDWELEYPKPKLEDGEFVFPNSKEFVEWICKSHADLQRYADMASEEVGGELTTQGASGVQRVVNNIKEKMKKEVEE